MTILSHLIAGPALLSRSLAITAILGGTMLAVPLNSARADTVGDAAFQLAQAATPQTQPRAAAAATKGETVEARIARLRKALKITPNENVQWNAVAQSMRENASNMDKLVAEHRMMAPQSMSAVDDLQMYQKFSQAHVDGLKNLIASFSTLYSIMPDTQKKVADSVFQSAHDKALAHG
jgi:periplasmic protein CpxP/Spy